MFWPFNKISSVLSRHWLLSFAYFNFFPGPLPANRGFGNSIQSRFWFYERFSRYIKTDLQYLLDLRKGLKIQGLIPSEDLGEITRGSSNSFGQVLSIAVFIGGGLKQFNF